MYKFYNLAERNYISKEEWNDNGNGNFAKVHFRIDTIGFDCARGTFSNDAVRPQWYDEASEIIRDFGIVESCGYKQNNEYLYAHPQDISGIVEKSKIKDIADIPYGKISHVCTYLSWCISDVETLRKNNFSSMESINSNISYIESKLRDAENKLSE